MKRQVIVMICSLLIVLAISGCGVGARATIALLPLMASEPHAAQGSSKEIHQAYPKQFFYHEGDCGEVPSNTDGEPDTFLVNKDQLWQVEQTMTKQGLWGQRLVFTIDATVEPCPDIVSVLWLNPVYGTTDAVTASSVISYFVIRGENFAPKKIGNCAVVSEVTGDYLLDPTDAAWFAAIIKALDMSEERFLLELDLSADCPQIIVAYQLIQIYPG